MQKICVAGYERRKICEAKCFICLEWNFDLRYFEEGIQKRQRTSRRVRFISFPFEVIRNPHVSALRCKKVSAVCFLCSHSVMSIYIYIHIYICLLSRAILTVAIASREFFRFVSA